MQCAMRFTTEPGDQLTTLRDTLASLPLDDSGACAETLRAARAVASGKFEDSELSTLVAGLEHTDLGRQIREAFTHDYVTMQEKALGHA